MKTILRWIAVPFASVLGSFIAYAVYMLFNSADWRILPYMPSESGEITIGWLLLFFAAKVIQGVAFVGCGVVTAPSHQKATSIVLATINACLCIGSVVLTFMAQGQWHTWLGSIVCLAGGVYAASLVCKTDVQ